MMKKIQLYILGLFTLFLASICYSCSKSDPLVEEPKQPSLNIESSNLVLPQAGGKVTIIFSTTDNWIATVGSSWVSISQSNGSAGSNSIILTAKENDTYDERNCNITITTGSISKNVTVTQKQKDALLVTSNKIEIKSEGGDAQIEVKANINFEVKVDDNCKDWVSVVSTRALSTYNLSLKVLENSATKSREGKVFIVSGDKKEEVSIYQQGTSASLILTQAEYSVSSEGDTIKVELQSNTDYSVKMPVVDWISECSTRAMSTYTHYFIIAANTEYDSRTADIIFYDKENNLSETVRIIQAQKDAIIVARKEYNLTSEAQELDFDIQSNIDFTVEVSGDWINEVQTRGLSTQKLHFNIEENTKDESREAFIKFQANQIEQIIKIKQNGGDHIPYVTFAAANNQAMYMTRKVSGMEYSVGYAEWSTLGTKIVDFGGSLGVLRLRNKNEKGTSTDDYESNFSTIVFDNNTPVSCSGDIRTLIDYKNYSTVSTASARFCCLFENCSQLTSAPELPASNIASYCYYKMFSGCTGLSTAPNLPATWLDKECYNSMFLGCKSLVIAPELPATNLDEGCYSKMFNGCSSLSNAPELPATTLATSCYSYMFRDCSGLTTAPELPATTLANSCYYNMFRNCISLTIAPELPAKKLANSCYYNMFCGCSSLRTPPVLPASSLADYCYSNMFRDCASLTTAPELSATKLVQSCYSEMFKGCTSLNYIKMFATDISASDCLINWVDAVASEGTFIKNVNATWKTVGSSGLPDGWKTIYYDLSTGNYYKDQGKTQECDEQGNTLDLATQVTVSLTGMGTTMTSSGVYYSRTYTIRNRSSVDIYLNKIGTSNFHNINATLAAGQSKDIELFFNYNVTPKVSVYFTYNSKEYVITTN